MRCGGSEGREDKTPERARGRRHGQCQPEQVTDQRSSSSGCTPPISIHRSRVCYHIIDIDGSLLVNASSRGILAPVLDMGGVASIGGLTAPRCVPDYQMSNVAIYLSLGLSPTCHWYWHVLGDRLASRRVVWVGVVRNSPHAVRDIKFRGCVLKTALGLIFGRREIGRRGACAQNVAFFFFFANRDVMAHRFEISNDLLCGLKEPRCSPGGRCHMRR